MAIMKRYDAYKDSGVEWLREMPEHWELKRLKELIKIQNSNVDKKSHENEISVRLCNYVDVYKNEFINSLLDFMQATADESEIKQFTIKKSDVLITKDSETCDDIAVPALATETLEGVLCGYHLAQFRIKEKMFSGAYLFRLFQSKSYGFRFVISAKGITRVGLGQSAIADSLTPVPPLPEQKAIATYLDTKTALIDRKIDLLTQKATQYGKLKQSLINETVTRGLDKTVSMKDSGVDWLGDVPEHWKVNRLKNLAYIKTGGKDTIDNVEEGAYPFFVRSQTIERINSYSFDGEAILTAGDGVGVGKVFHHVNCKFDYHQRVYKISNFRRVVGKFVFYYMRENFHKDALRLNAKSTVDSLRMPMFQNFTIAFGDIEEQQAIVDYLDTKTVHIDRIVETINTQIEKLKELRKTLINDVVTGKIKVA